MAAFLVMVELAWGCMMVPMDRTVLCRCVCWTAVAGVHNVIPVVVCQAQEPLTYRLCLQLDVPPEVSATIVGDTHGQFHDVVHM
jgi:hypothetical protein